MTDPDALVQLPMADVQRGQSYDMFDHLDEVPAPVDFSYADGLQVTFAEPLSELARAQVVSTLTTTSDAAMADQAVFAEIAEAATEQPDPSPDTMEARMDALEQQVAWIRESLADIAGRLAGRA